MKSISLEIALKISNARTLFLLKMNSDAVKDAKWIFLSICKLLFQSNFLNIVDDEMIERHGDKYHYKCISSTKT